MATYFYNLSIEATLRSSLSFRQCQLWSPLSLCISKATLCNCSMERLLRCSILLVVSYHIPQRFNHPVNSLKNCTFSLDTLPAASIKKIMPMMAWMVGINFIVMSLSLLNMKCILCTISDFLAYYYSYSEAD